MTGRKLHADERGVALITVLGVSLIMALLLTAVLSYGIGSMRQARDDQDWNAALASAEAGLDDFLYRINRDNAYWQLADPDWDGGSGTPDPENVALQAGTFAPVPELSSGDTNGSYHYDVDASAIGSEGNIVVTSTGRVLGEDRTVRATLRKETFLDFLYFTEYETLDPTAYPDNGDADDVGSQLWAMANCQRHRYDTPARDDDCVDIYWYGDDVRQDEVHGPFHTNDTIAVNGGPVWHGETTTSDQERIDAWAADTRDPKVDKPYFGSGTPTFPDGWPQYKQPMRMPPTNDAIKAQADPVVGGDGCLYRGSTFIRLRSDGSAEVRSSQTADSDPGKCPTDGVMASLPENGVIYVEALDASTCDALEPGAPHDYDLTGDITEYDYCAGNVFIEGELDGRLTVAAQNNIIVSNDLTYAGGRGADSDDMLGLVAQNFVEVMHPIRVPDDGWWEYDAGKWPANQPCFEVRNNRCIRRLAYKWEEIPFRGGDIWREPYIDAAMLSVSHSFRVQNHRLGVPMDELHLHGAMAQKFRGPVGTFSQAQNKTISGYEKDYVYDTRLKFLSPPHFLNPVRSAWGISEWSEEQTPEAL